MYVSSVNDDYGLLSGRRGLTGSCRCDCIMSHLQMLQTKAVAWLEHCQEALPPPHWWKNNDWHTVLLLPRLRRKWAFSRVIYHHLHVRSRRPRSLTKYTIRTVSWCESWELQKCPHDRRAGIEWSLSLWASRTFRSWMSAVSPVFGLDCKILFLGDRKFVDLRSETPLQLYATTAFMKVASASNLWFNGHTRTPQIRWTSLVFWIPLLAPLVTNRYWNLPGFYFLVTWVRSAVMTCRLTTMCCCVRVGQECEVHWFADSCSGIV